MGRREAARHRERRAVYSAIQAGTLQRQVPSADAVAALFRAIDHRDVTAYGVCKLASIDLDGLHPMPSAHGTNGVGFERHVTLLSYAAWRRRHDCVKHLLVAGAAPTMSERNPDGAIKVAADEARLRELLTRRFGAGMASAAAVYAVELIVQMRCFAARDAALGAALPPCSVCGEAGSTVCFDSCGCPCCEGCVWNSLLRDNERGELKCPSCGSSSPLRGNGDTSGEVDPEPASSSPAPEPEPALGSTAPEPEPAASAGEFDPELAASGAIPRAEWVCECCAYSMSASRSHCRNCCAPRAPPSRRPPPSFCDDLQGAIEAFEASKKDVEASKKDARARWLEDEAAVTRSVSSVAEGDGLRVGHDDTSAAAISAAGDSVASARAECDVRVLVEISVDSRRCFGKKLCFLMGSAPFDISPAQSSNMATHGVTDSPGTTREDDAPAPASFNAADLPSELQLVLDMRHIKAFLDGETDAEPKLAITNATRGERVVRRLASQILRMLACAL